MNTMWTLVDVFQLQITRGLTIKICDAIYKNRVESRLTREQIITQQNPLWMIPQHKIVTKIDPTMTESPVLIVLILLKFLMSRLRDAPPAIRCRNITTASISAFLERRFTFRQINKDYYPRLTSRLMITMLKLASR